MYYCKSRYYVPEWCRWLNADSIGYLDPTNINGLNLFAYCNNNPVMGIDPNGNFWILAAFIAMCVGLLFVLKSDSKPKPYKSSITKKDVNINGANPTGSIIVSIEDRGIEIFESYRYNEDDDINRILDIIMASAEYRDYNYTRTKKVILQNGKLII